MYFPGMLAMNSRNLFSSKQEQYAIATSTVYNATPQQALFSRIIVYSKTTPGS